MTDVNIYENKCDSLYTFGCCLDAEQPCFHSFLQDKNQNMTLVMTSEQSQVLKVQMVKRNDNFCHTEWVTAAA